MAAAYFVGGKLGLSLFPFEKNVAVLWPSGGGRTTAPVAPSPAPTVSSLPPSTEWSGVVSRVLPGTDGRFTAFSIDRDGTLAGTDVAYGADGFDRFSQPIVIDIEPFRYDGQDWQVEVMPSFVADRRSVYSLRYTDPATTLNLWCTDRATGSEQQLNAGDVDRTTLLTDRGHVVWTYHGDGTVGSTEPDEVWTAAGCGPARKLPVTGDVVAVDWPRVYVRDVEVAWGVSVFDAETLTTTPVPRPQADVPGPISTAERLPAFAANGDVLAWMEGRTVQYLDLRTGKVTRLPDLPLVPGVNGVASVVTVGDRTLAAFVRGSDSGPDAVAGLVHDLRTGETEPVSGEAWAAGPWVVTGSPDRYAVKRVR